MCLEFLCGWCHKEDDGPEHHRQSHHTSLPPAGTEYPARGESPSKPRSERSNNGTDTWNSDTYPGRHDPPSKPRSEMSSNGDTYPARHDPPSKPDSGRSSNGTDTWNDDTYPARHDPPSKPHSERPNNDTGNWNVNTYPARQDPPLKPHPDLYSGNRNPVVSGVAVNNGDTKRKDENPKTSSMVFNGEKDLTAVHPRSSALAPKVANNTVLAAPVQQPNLRRGADSNLMHTNNHYPTVGDSARSNGHMRKDEEEDNDDDDDDDEEEEVSKAAQAKNRWY